jgi:hypothetical protein
MARRTRPLSTAPIDYESARQLLADVFAEAEADFRHRTPPAAPSDIQTSTEILFSTRTQLYREALLGCAIARNLNSAINLRHPYMNHGDGAFNGRTLDERVVNPFLQDRLVPASRGPYLATFRRSVKFIPETRNGLRDQTGYDAFLTVMNALESAQEPSEKRSLLRHLLYHFIALRDEAAIALLGIQRLSLEQYDMLIGHLLQLQSGGLIPVLLAVALFQTIRDCFELDWEIEWQGINVADQASGVGGDITIKRDASVVLAVEITERLIDRSRVVSTFNTKIAPHGIDDYLFLFSGAVPKNDARDAAKQFFAQGHEINFIPVRDWVMTILATVGLRCRRIFTEAVLALLRERDVPAALKVAWNNQIRALIT